jgi:ketosteroid isomerase-like protein
MKKTLIILLLCLTRSLLAQEPDPRTSAPRATPGALLQDFIQAFDNLEWDRFRSFFADDATVFYPRGFVERANGRREFEANFRKVFEQIRGGQTHPPYMNLQPRDLQIQRFGDLAIATFHLDDRPGVLNRRTLVLHKMKGQWTIVHLHASETALSP